MPKEDPTTIVIAYHIETISILAPNLAWASALSKMFDGWWLFDGEVVQWGQDNVSRLKAAYADAAYVKNVVVEYISVDVLQI